MDKNLCGWIAYISPHSIFVGARDSTDFSLRDSNWLAALLQSET